MTFLSLTQVLDMPVLRKAGAHVAAGTGGLDRRVRWVHTTELADIAPLLRGGDLVLSTGIALPDTVEGLEAFAESLDDSEAAGLLIELGRRWTVLPDALVGACERLGLPLVGLTREVRFAAVAQAVGERIVDEQLEELREAQRVHETFTDLSIAEAGPAEVLEAVQRLAGAAVVLEDEQHHVLDYRAGPRDVGVFLTDWKARSRAVRLDGRTAWDSGNGWLVTRLGRRDRAWGRLVVEAPQTPPQQLIAVAERAAAALAMHRLNDRHRDSLVRRTHQELLLGLLADPTDADLLRRCELAGLPTVKRQFVGLTVRAHAQARSRVPTSSNMDDVIASLVHAAHGARTPALISAIDRDVRVLLSLPHGVDDARITDDLAAGLVRRHAVVISAGRATTRVGEVDRTLREADHVADSVRSDAVSRVVHRLEDVHLRGLLTLLRDDDRVRMFVTRELGSLKDHDAQHRTDLLACLWALLSHLGSKSDAAASMHLSRPAFYDRLAKIRSVLGVDLDDPDIRVSLHVALMADDLARPPR